MEETKKYKKKRQNCTLCPNSYSKREYLAKHMTKDHGEELERKPPGREPAFKAIDMSDPRPFKCPDCIKEYRKSKHLSRHRREVHTQNFCTECNLPVRNLKVHMICEHGVELPRNFQCDACEKQFLTKANLQAHTLRMHREVERTFECGVCAKAFAYANDLRKHTRTHSLDRSILCDICGDAFKSPDSLKSHMRRHTGERPYKWWVINDYRLDSFSSNLLIEICDFFSISTTCDKAFSSSNSLDIHNRIHTGKYYNQNSTKCPKLIRFRLLYQI